MPCVFEFVNWCCRDKLLTVRVSKVWRVQATFAPKTLEHPQLVVEALGNGGSIKRHELDWRTGVGICPLLLSLVHLITTLVPRKAGWAGRAGYCGED
jgi:hypothetical protein